MFCPPGTMEIAQRNLYSNRKLSPHLSRPKRPWPFRQDPGSRHRLVRRDGSLLRKRCYSGFRQRAALCSRIYRHASLGRPLNSRAQPPSSLPSEPANCVAIEPASFPRSEAERGSARTHCIRGFGLLLISWCASEWSEELKRFCSLLKIRKFWTWYRTSWVLPLYSGVRKCSAYLQ